MPSFHGPPRVIAEGRDVLRAERYETEVRELREFHHRELLASSIFRRLILQWRIHREARRRAESLMPSEKSLFLRQR